MEEQKKFNPQLSKKIHTVENSLNKKIDGLQSEMEHKFDNLQYSISRLGNQHVHQEKESQEEECLSDTMVEEQCQQQLLLESSDIGAAVYPWEKKEVVPTLLTEEGSEKETMEEPQKSTAQPKNSPLPVHIRPSLAAQMHTQNTYHKGHPICTACAAKHQKISGHCSSLCHYIKDTSSCPYCMT